MINPTVPLNDPDGLALGYLPGSSDLKLFVPTLDGFSVFGNLTASLPSLTSIAVDLTAVGLTALGNWSSGGKLGAGSGPAISIAIASSARLPRS